MSFEHEIAARCLIFGAIARRADAAITDIAQHEEQHEQVNLTFSHRRLPPDLTRRLQGSDFRPIESHA
jgi:hypothetical protein